ncbi:MAG: 4Fe-4S binding protein, partial [Myxococcales bacterium]|nr:4Fe-4S binding protein [Myxococcales bacterium]
PPAALEAARRLQAALPDPDAEARVVTVAAGDATGDAELHVRALPADDERDAVLLAARSREHLELGVALLEGRADGAALERVVLSGVGRELTARLVLGRGRLADASPLWIDPARCDPCGACAELCPVSAIDGAARPVPTFDFDRCVQCALCVEHCPQAAIRPIVTTQMNLAGRDLTRAQERLATIRRRDVAPIDDPITRRLHRAPAIVAGRPLVILGLATVTMMEHAAALLIDGELVAAVEEERLARVRHYRWSDPGWPGSSLASDPSLPIAAAWPARAIEAVLGLAGMDLDRVDAIAINGVPARLSHAFLGAGSWRPPQVLQSRGLFHVPHHLAHAASVYGLSNLDDAWILSVDGRGDFETATLWRAEGDDIAWLDAEPFAPDRSLGGVYETITRVLGFGSHGQGSTMALAALGEPRVRLDDCLGLDDRGRMVLSEWRADRRFAARTRGRDAPLTQEHKDLAASAQRALEETVAGWLGARVREPNPRLLVCGGVALNCRMNGELRRKFEPKDMSAPPGANDAGTAIGAALIAHRELTGTLPRLGLGHTHLGAAWSDDAIARSLARMRVPHARVDPARATAELLAGGAVVCWFQGRMEFGPRALGGRSILGDPRRAELKARMNAMKSRQPWRPFGPSVLAGEQGAWFLEDWDSRFMLFAVTVRPERRAEIPVVVHDDGTTRPQVVHAEEHPRYHAMIQAFQQRTGVPMVVNTSFNRGGEPIVHTPAEALRSFVGLGADALVLGDCLVRRSELARRPRG